MARGQPEGEAIYRPEVNPEDLPRKIVPEYRQPPVVAEAFGRAGTDVTSALYGKYQADSATYAGNQLAAFRMSQLQDLQEKQQALPAGDPGNFTQDYLKSFDKNAQPLLDAAQGNPVATRMISKGLQEFRDTLQPHVMGWEATQRKGFQKDSIEQNVLNQLPAIEAHPELASQIGSTTMDQVNSTILDPSIKASVGMWMHEQVSQAAANGYARQDPRGVLVGLNDPSKMPEALSKLDLKAPQIEAVRAKANEHLLDGVNAALSQSDVHGAQRLLNSNADVMDPRTFEAAQRGILAQQEHQVVMSEHFERQASGDLIKQGLTLQYQGKLTPDWVLQHQRAFEPAAFEHMLSVATGHEDKASDPTTLVDLTRRTLAGEDTRDEIVKASTVDHTLQGKDAVALLKDVSQERPGWVKQGSEFITKALSVSDQMVGPDRIIAATAQANAMRDWQSFAAQHPNATTDEAKKAQNQIVSSYGEISPERVLFKYPAPRFLVGTRYGPVDENGKPDFTLQATSRRTAQAFKSGQITQQEMEEESLRIQAMRDYFVRQQQAEAAAAAKRKAAEE